MYIPWTKLFPYNAHLLCIRAEFSVVHTKQYDYAQMDLRSKHFGSKSQGFYGLTSNGDFLLRALFEFNWLTDILA